VEAIAAVICRLKVELASSTRTSTTFGPGLVQIVDDLLHEGHAVASHLAMMAFWAL